jgi:hypothetical protein
MERRVEYFGFELERETAEVDVFPPGQEERARALLAEGLARGEVRHVAVKRNQPAIDEVREAWRRSGGRTPRLGMAELAAFYVHALQDVRSMQDFQHAPLRFDADAFVLREERARLARLPSRVRIRDQECEVHYDVEESEAGVLGVARLRLPEKLARTLVEQELPALDRPLRFIVTRGARGAVRADSLEALQEELDQPFTRDELRDVDRGGRGQRAKHGRGGPGGSRGGGRPPRPGKRRRR